MPPRRDEAAQMLIVDYQNGDRQAFNRLLDEYQYWQYIFKSLRVKGISSTDAEDYTQQICVRLMNGLKKFRFACPFEGYLNIIINNKAINHYRSRYKQANGKKIKLVFRSLDVLISIEESEKALVSRFTDQNAPPDADLQFQELRRIIAVCLRLFKNKTIKLITCLWLKGLKQRHITALLEIPFGTVGGCLERGKKRLRHCLKKNYC